MKPSNAINYMPNCRSVEAVAEAGIYYRLKSLDHTNSIDELLTDVYFREFMDGFKTAFEVLENK